MKKIILLLFVMLYFLGLYGQDIHISQNYMYPIVINPSFAGNIKNGNLQFGTLYRNQAFTVTPNPYSTYFAFVNTKFESRYINDDNIGLALMFLNDDSGKGRLNTNKTSLDLAYHFNFDSFLSRISIGTKFAYISRSFGDFRAFKFEEDLVGTGFSENANINKNSYFDLGFGLSFSIKLLQYTNLNFGFSAVHLNSNFNNSISNKIQRFDTQYNVFLEIYTPLNENLYLLPKLYYNKTLIDQELLIQTLLSYQYNNNLFKGGLGLRYGDAMQLLLGAEFGNWEVGLAYDINISDLANVSKYASGFELGIKFNYQTTRHFKKPDGFLAKLFSEPKLSKTQKAKLKEIIINEKKRKTIIVKKEQPIILHNILFDYDKYNILPEAEGELTRLLNLLNKYKNMIIELSSHTDCRGEEEYNLQLSQRRAESTKKWLTDRGITSDRILAKGYGEKKLLNNCVDGVECTEEEHRINRRTEFKIIAGPKSIRW